MPPAQASPRVWHVEAPGTAWHVPELTEVPLQMPEQHWASLVHGVVEAVPSRFRDEMHSTFVAHRPPRLEVASAAQIPVQHELGFAGSHAAPA